MKTQFCVCKQEATWIVAFLHRKKQRKKVIKMMRQRVKPQGQVLHFKPTNSDKAMVCIPLKVYQDLINTLTNHAENEINHGNYCKKIIKEIREQKVKK